MLGRIRETGNDAATSGHRVRLDSNPSAGAVPALRSARGENNSATTGVVFPVMRIGAIARAVLGAP